MVKREDIQKSIKDNKWQKFRVSLKGLSTEVKLKKLREWKELNNNSKKSQVQVENYINALKRGGLL